MLLRASVGTAAIAAEVETNAHRAARCIGVVIDPNRTIDDVFGCLILDFANLVRVPGVVCVAVFIYRNPKFCVPVMPPFPLPLCCARPPQSKGRDSQPSEQRCRAATS